MHTTVQKWGNSYAVRLPRAAIRKTRLAAGRGVRIEASARGLSITPIHEHERSLAELAAAITSHNRPMAVDYGAPRGGEAW